MLADSDNRAFGYLPVPEIVTRLGLSVTGAGTDRVPSGSPYPRQQQPELYDFNWEVGWVLSEYHFGCVAESGRQFNS